MDKRNMQYSAVAGIVVLGAIIGLAIHLSGSGNVAPTATTQPDTRPPVLTVVPDGSGVSSTQAAAALQSQSSQSSTLGASTGTQSSLMGQPTPSLQNAGNGGITNLLR
ncbi:MAG TPA: hypothetical protein VLE73_04345 [Candidatus Saccharimonadales bacterium]|nr:hypothetical protein [Candidatus Saccharimonadales bacterium]